MSRYRTIFTRTEEEKRNLKVDLRFMPLWKEELESIFSYFKQYDLSKVISAAYLIHQTANNLFPWTYDNESELNLLNRWKKSLSIDSLVHITSSHNSPWFLYKGCFSAYGKNMNLLDLVEAVRSLQNKVDDADKELVECRAKGVSSSFWVRCFANKVSPDFIENRERERNDSIKLLDKLSDIDASARLLSEIRSKSLKYSTRAQELQKLLSLAEEKKSAIECFEDKLGNALGKAAAVDKKTRNRATSLKVLVEKTNQCPYCNGELGTDPHLDHIYPVSKGGLSILENLVWCCSTCNSLKSDKGLMQFLKEQSLPFEETLSRLHSLGKHI